MKQTKTSKFVSVLLAFVLSFSMLGTASLSLFAQTAFADEEAAKPAEISFNKGDESIVDSTSINLYTADLVKAGAVTVTASAEDVTGEIEWTSSDKAILKAEGKDNDCTLTPVAPGKVTVTAVISGTEKDDPNLAEGSFEVEVTNYATAIRLTDTVGKEVTEVSGLSMTVGGSAKLSAAALPANASNGNETIYWAAVNTGDAVHSAPVVTVDGSGTVKAVAAGTATVSAYMKTCFTGTTYPIAKCSVTVDPGAAEAKVFNISLDKDTATLYKESDGYYPSETVGLTVTPSSHTSVTYAVSSSNEKVASVAKDQNDASKFVVTPKAVGKTTVTVTGTNTKADGKEEKVSATCDITVKAVPKVEAGYKVELDRDKVALVGESEVTLNATVIGSEGIDKDASVTFMKVSDAVDIEQCEPDTSVTVSAVKRTTEPVEVTAFYTDEKGTSYKASCAVTVSNPVTGFKLIKVEDKSVAANASIVMSNSSKDAVQLQAVPMGELENSATDDNYKITWNAENENVIGWTDAEDEKGELIADAVEVYGKNFGSTYIAATCDVDGGDSYVSYCAINVTNPATGVALDDKVLALEAGDTYTLGASLSPEGADEEATTQITFKSSDPKIATVNATTGEVTAVSAGEATITASATTTRTFTDSCAVYVAEAGALSTAGDEEAVYDVSIESAYPGSTALAQVAKPGLKLVAEQVEVAEDTLAKLTANGAQVAEQLDIHFVDANGENAAVNFGNDKVLVKIAMTDAMKALNNLKVYYIPETGSPEQIEVAYVSGDYLCFTTSHFSTYVVTGETGAAGDASDAIPMYRLYNPNSGEHFYTADTNERNTLVALGWNPEGQGWTAPSEGIAVFRLYNPNAGEHHYTTSEAEKAMLINAGWNDEGIGWYSDMDESVPVYRLYNPNAYANNHHYTTDAGERDVLKDLGWQDEGTGWCGVK